MKILVLDNYDSFTYNLVEYLRLAGADDIEIYRNREIAIEDIEKYDKIVLSPGPGIPDEAGILKEVISVYGSRKPILGVCLGEQAIGEVYGAKIENISKVYHGVATDVFKTEVSTSLFDGLGDKFIVGRYHSWCVVKDSVPEVLEITAVDAEGDVMAIRHKEYDVEGVQFHPESILTPEGLTIIKNWLNR